MIYFQSKANRVAGILILFLLNILLACSSSKKEEASLATTLPRLSSSDYLYKKPVEQVDGWLIDSVFQEQKAEELVNSIYGDSILGLNGVLLSRKGSLILEEYQLGWKPDSLLSLKENELLLIATLAGVYQKQQPGFMNSLVNIPTHSYTMKDMKKRRESATMPVASVNLQQLLKMETDLLCRPQQQVIKEIAKKGSGQGFYYCPANYEAIADWLEMQAEEPLSFFAEENFFEPLEIDRYQWDDQERRLAPRDMLKIGAIHATNGRWHQNQILPDNWVLHLKSRAYDKEAKGKFAWGWWQELLPVNGRQYAMFYSKGSNYLLVYVPDLDASILLVGNLKRSAADYFPLLRDHAIPVFEQK